MMTWKEGMFLLVGLMAISLVSGCDGPVGPEIARTYETAVFGTFRGINASHSEWGFVAFDSTSYVYINKSDGTYGFHLHGTDKGTHTKECFFFQTGVARLSYVTYTAPHGWNLGVWKGRLWFDPDSSFHAGTWTFEFHVYDSDQLCTVLSVDGGGASIPLYPESVKLIVFGWRINSIGN